MRPTETVVESIRKAYPTQANIILGALAYDCIMRCWFFWLNGMYHGVEEDGYIHT